MDRQRRAGLASVLLRAVIRGYQLVVSPVLPPSCRFLPGCSDYALEALRRHGAWRGLGLALWRLARCHPWGGSGYDPVPENAISEDSMSGDSRSGLAAFGHRHAGAGR